MMFGKGDERLVHDPSTRPDDHPAIAASRSDHLIFIVVTLLYWSTLYVYVPILSPFMSDRGYSGAIIGVVLGSYGFTQLLIRFPLGLYSDKLHKRKPFLLLGMISGALSCLLFMMPGSWVWPLAGRIMSGVCASVWAAFTVLYSAYFRSSESTKAMSNISFMTAAGQLIGMILSGQLAGARGWNAAFAAGIGFGLVGLALAFLVKEPKEGVERAPISLRMLRDVVRTRLLVHVSILSILAHGVLFITMFGFTPLHATALGASRSELTWLVIAFMVPHAFTTFVTGRYLAPKFGIWNVIAAGFVLSAVFTLAIPLSDSLRLLALTQAFNGIAQGLHLPLFLALAIAPFETARRATAMGFYQAVYSAGMFAGPFVAGFMNEQYGLASGFWLGGAIALLSALLSFRWRAASTVSAGRTLSG